MIPPVSGIYYTDGAKKYSGKLVYFFTEIGMSQNVAPQAITMIKERAENKASAGDQVVNTSDLRECIAELAVEEEKATDVGEAYAKWVCPIETKIGIIFGTKPWTDKEEWEPLCP